MYVDVYHLINFAMYFLGGVAIIFGIIAAIIVAITFLNVNKLVKRVDKLMEKSEESIHKTIVKLPEVAQNVNDASVGIKQGIDKASDTVETLGNTICETVATVNEGTEGFFDFVSITGEILKSVGNILPLWKKK